MDNEVRWGVLTTARIARNRFLPAAARAGNARVVAISSASGSAAAVAQEFSVDRAYDSHEALLADPDVDAVYVPFPNHLHREWAVKAARAGKHVLCEKPLVPDWEGHHELVQATRETGVHLLEGFMYRFHEQHRVIAELLASGALGELVSLHARVNFAIDRSPGEPRLREEQYGGALNDVGTYGVDVLNKLVGRPPSRVAGLGVSLSDPVDTSMAALLDYDGVLGTVDCGFEGPKDLTLRVTGTRGSVTASNAFDPDPGELVTLTIEGRDGSTELREVADDAFRKEIEFFSGVVLDGGEAMPFRELTEWNLAVREALHLSMAEGRFVAPVVEAARV
ncbi:Gfo/Idh/MocA family protein [Arthrobacter celericrescens]|uniref:Gfo/Idh/MocA family protein n=1 Tax=Arthrobacter celericrescens TaxID=2320851 RepID=UPI000EA368BB|nr:Gfo/Idh/MocA family oxidoreductase [Arthrobacter celericrescens]